MRLSKTFGSTRVLRDASLVVRAGEIRALLGQNGSGKSTLIKILAGIHTPDDGGSLAVRGEGVALPVIAHRLHEHGIGFMHQDMGLEPTMTVLENFCLGMPAMRRPLGRCNWAGERKRLASLLDEFGAAGRPEQFVTDLAPGQRAVVALVRAIDRVGGQDGLLVLDEPTAALDRRGYDLLARAVRTAAERGNGVLFVTHNLDEVFDLADSVTVLRDGEVVADAPARDFDESSLVRSIVGRDLDNLYPEVVARPETRPLLRVAGLSGRAVEEVSFEVHAGEIVGLTGVAGMGQDDVPELVYGATPRRSGTVSMAGKSVSGDPPSALAAGIVMIPADRRGKAIDADGSLVENMTLQVERRYFRRGRMLRGAQRRDAAEALVQFEVRPSDPDHRIGDLSGGNQQKAVLGKWIRVFGSARVLVLHEPTQGVDIGARSSIFRIIEDCAESGLGILYVSKEHDDLAHLCHRVLVMRSGRIVSEVERPFIAADRLTALCMSTDR